MRAPIRRFTGPWLPLRMSHPWQVPYEGHVYATLRHAFHAVKASREADRQWVASAVEPAEAERRGNLVNLRWSRARWEGGAERVDLMYQLNLAKFFADPPRILLLLQSNGQELIHGNTVHEQFWGDCVCGRPECVTPGQNMLGRVLMEIRHQTIVNQWLPAALLIPPSAAAGS